MASLLSSHLEQINLCATSISDLPFPGPKIFTDALLSNQHDITSLIRDTEAHERALFHLAPPPLPTKASDFTASVAGQAQTAKERRATQYGAARQPKAKAVAAVLGGDLYNKTRKEGGMSRQKGDLDVELLLHGAEKLTAVYPIEGAKEKIAALRRRHEQLAVNIAHYEDRVNRNTQELQLQNRPTSGGAYDDEELSIDDNDAMPATKEDLMREAEEVRELERKKQMLEERVTGMSKDLGGLMR
ncbi:DASH complex, subunit Spc34 [Teratosphaeria nubilosa]|uniref:DASH complex subunit SPC34 n=1 Tax=Teratosphaeria nubilosa TaxID=161662 RepID=A0A6G1L9H4_9PEZI|nr:DASH complex, subunit Spc34 [Teratosphaeria nubilosa]